ncbi:MAG: hypothetical protein MUF72_10380 [Elainella sp. Prado103]|jgi:hypothetical protein|nr:hypothetical protein [Elainella sp. Prado103]
MQPAPPTSIPLSSIATAYSLNISRIDRWLVHQRLQELQINAWCLADGSIWAEVPSPGTALLIRSVTQQVLSPRPDLVRWLDRCWELKFVQGSSAMHSNLYSPGGA